MWKLQTADESAVEKRERAPALQKFVLRTRRFAQRPGGTGHGDDSSATRWDVTSKWAPIEVKLDATRNHHVYPGMPMSVAKFHGNSIPQVLPENPS
jgi:hypothetical protein